MRDSWAEVTLGDIATIVPGKYLPKSEYVEDGEYFVYGSNSVMGKHSKFLIEPPHTVMAAIGAYAGAVRYSPDPSWVNNNAFGLLAKPAVLPGYFYLWLNSKLDLSTVVAGTGQPYVQRPSLNATKVALPPLSDQKRIVDLISSVDDYIAALQQQGDNARSARNAVLHELLNAGGDDWTETTIGAISHLVSMRLSPEQLNSGVPYIGLEHLDSSNPVIARSGLVASVSGSVTPFEVEDVLFGRLRPYLHKVAFATLSGVCSPEVLVLRALPSCAPKFLHALCSADATVKACVEMSAGTRMPRTSASDLASIKVALPPLSEQERIVEIVAAMDGVVSTTEQTVQDSQKLRSSLLSGLLSGDHEIPETYDRLLGAA
jgi:type I restriction enzyme S subunit